MSFQDMDKINEAYKRLESKCDLHGILKRPYAD